MGSVKIVKASAGSGKTYRLAYEYVRAVIGEPSGYRSILAVTFTNKATEEMKRRIVGQLNSLVRDGDAAYMSALMDDLKLSREQVVARARLARTRILHDYSRFSILTIDKFFQRIIRSFIKELGIDLNFNLELKTDTILSSATDALVEDIALDARLRAWIVGFVEEKIEQGRPWGVKSDLAELGSEIFKEEYRRNAAEVKSMEQIAEIVSATDMKLSVEGEKIRSLAQQAMALISECGLGIDDFSSKSSGVAGYLAKTATGVMTSPSKNVQKALDSDDKWAAKSSPARARVMAIVPRLRPLLEGVCSAMGSYLKLEISANLMRDNFRNFALLSDLSGKVRQMCDQGNIMPISETNAILGKLISGNDTPFIFEKAGNHFDRFMMDEFQDTSAMQWENFLPLLHNAVSQSPDSPVLIVGDIKQAIYRWRGGDWEILESGVERAFEEVEHEELAVNYRSARRIVEFNNELIGEAVRQENARLEEVLAGAREAGYIESETSVQMAGLMERAYRGHSQRPASEQERGYVNVTIYADDKDEQDSTVAPIVRRVEQLQRRGYAPGDIAFLVRSNREGEQVAGILLEHKSRAVGSRYSYDVVTQEALTIGLSPAVRFVISCLELSANPSSDVKRALYNRWLDRPFSQALTPEESAFLRSLSLFSPQEGFEAVVMRYDLGRRREDIAYLQALHEQVISFGKSNVADIPLFLKWWNESGVKQSVNIPATSGAMTIITVHKAKGLDFKAVILPCCDWPMSRKAGSILWARGVGDFDAVGAVPLNYKRDMGESLFADGYYREMVMSHIDNMNLLYVALTRACNELHIMIPADGAEIAQGKKRTKGRVGALVLDSLGFTANGGTSEVVVGSTVGRTRSCGRYRVFEFGSPARMEAAQPRNLSVSIPFISYPIETRLKLRLPSMRYAASQGASYSLAPRDYGILMHRAFEQAVGVADIKGNVHSMELDGVISTDESASLSSLIDDALTDPVVASWFDGSWDEVRNENDLVLPYDQGGQGFQTRRPDRVMIKGSRAVVVDYKFGLRREQSHKTQLRRYGEILERMGYSDVATYIWYVSLGDVEQV